MKIYRPFGLNELGGRENNEDAVFPSLEKANPEDRLFIVCDGVGGSAKGEVASSLICRQLVHYFSSNPVEIGDDGFIPRALKSVEEKLSEHQSLYPETKGMASTLTLLYLDDSKEKGLVAWVGDSRIYQIRDGKIIFKSKDHSEVQSLIDMGEITEEEAKIHARRNVILRAVSGQERPTRVDQVLLEDIEENDFFLLCTDGILEQVDDKKLKSWFLQNKSPEELKALVYGECQGRTKDNFSMYLVKIKEIERHPKLGFDTVPTLKEPKGKAERRLFGTKSGRNSWLRFLMGLVLLCLLLGAIYYLRKPNGTPAEDPIEKTDAPQGNPEGGQIPSSSFIDSDPETSDSAVLPTSNGEDSETALAEPNFDVIQGSDHDNAKENDFTLEIKVYDSRGTEIVPLSELPNWLIDRREKGIPGVVMFLRSDSLVTGDLERYWLGNGDHQDNSSDKEYVFNE